MASPLGSSNHSRLLIGFLAGISLSALAVFVSGLVLDLRATQNAAGASDAKLAASAETAAAPKRKDAYEITQALKKGGYLLYFRHPERQKWDSVIAFDVHEAATGKDAAKTTYKDAVCLTPKGKEEAKMIGQILKMSGIPVGTVAASPICRARETAQLAFGRIDVVNHGLIHTPVTNKTNAADFKNELKKLLTTVPIRKDTNTIISAHENTIRNHPDLFLDGTDLLKGPIVLETGLYVIQRDDSGGLHLLHKFMNLGELASNGLTLSSTGTANTAASAGAPPSARHP